MLSLVALVALLTASPAVLFGSTSIALTSLTIKLATAVVDDGLAGHMMP